MNKDVRFIHRFPSFLKRGHFRGKPKLTLNTTCLHHIHFSGVAFSSIYKINDIKQIRSSYIFVKIVYL